jgi:hypothetical protein
MTSMPLTWTIAYRRPKANRFIRDMRHALTWQQASDFSYLFGQANPGLEVWYVTTRLNDATIQTTFGKRPSLVRVTDVTDCPSWANDIPAPQWADCRHEKKDVDGDTCDAGRPRYLHPEVIV